MKFAVQIAIASALFAMLAEGCATSKFFKNKYGIRLRKNFGMFNANLGMKTKCKNDINGIKEIKKCYTEEEYNYNGVPTTLLKWYGGYKCRYCKYGKPVTPPLPQAYTNVSNSVNCHADDDSDTINITCGLTNMGAYTQKQNNKCTFGDVKLKEVMKDFENECLN